MKTADTWDQYLQKRRSSDSWFLLKIVHEWNRPDSTQKPFVSWIANWWLMDRGANSNRLVYIISSLSIEPAIKVLTTIHISYYRSLLLSKNSYLQMPNWSQSDTESHDLQTLSRRRECSWYACRQDCRASGSDRIWVTSLGRTGFFYFATAELFIGDI